MYTAPHRRISRRDFLKFTSATVAALGLSRLTAPSTSLAAGNTRQWQVTGQEIKALVAFDQTMQSFMMPRNIPGGGLAVSYKGRLVLARGYTWSADETDLVQPTSLFRIASVTKPITSAAIMSLVQANKLKLTDKVVNVLGLKAAPGDVMDARMKEITILNLLQHSGGWDRDTGPDAFDPMFLDYRIAQKLNVPLPISTKEIITYMNGQPLQFKPGTKSVYSNYGYCLLGRVIEQVAGQPYAAYVQSQVLAPLGIKYMIQGRSLLNQRAAGEVRYFTGDTGLYGSVFKGGNSLKVPIPYGTFNLENMDSHGRWAASPIDMIRFGISFDNPQNNPVLSADSIQTTFAPPPFGTDKSGRYYACGWAIVPVGSQTIPTPQRNTWHNGSLPGTTTYLVRRFDGINWAVFFNQRDDSSKLDYGDIDGALHKAADSVTWPTHDLFPDYTN